MSYYIVVLPLFVLFLSEEDCQGRKCSPPKKIKTQYKNITSPLKISLNL